MPLTTKNVLGRKAPKAAPKPAAKAAPKPAPQPQAAETVMHLEPMPENALADSDAPQADHHIIPDRPPSARQHDEVRGCWCFPRIEGNVVEHR